MADEKDILRLKELLEASKDIEDVVPLGQGKNLDALTKAGYEIPKTVDPSEHMRTKPKDPGFRLKGKPYDKAGVEVAEGAKDLVVREATDAVPQGKAYGKELVKSTGTDLVDATAKRTSKLKDILSKLGKGAKTAAPKALGAAGVAADLYTNTVQAAERPQEEIDKEREGTFAKRLMSDPSIIEGLETGDYLTGALGVPESPTGNIQDMEALTAETESGILNALAASETGEKAGRSPATVTESKEKTKDVKKVDKLQELLDKVKSMDSKSEEELKSARRKDMIFGLLDNVNKALSRFDQASAIKGSGQSQKRIKPTVSGATDFAKTASGDAAKKRKALIEEITGVKSDRAAAEASKLKQDMFDLKKQQFDYTKEKDIADREAKLELATLKADKTKPSKGQETVDKEYAKEYIEWTKGGKDKVSKNLDNIDRAIDIMEKNKGIFTGPIDSFIEVLDSDTLRKGFNPQGQVVKDLVNNVSMQNLKKTLGGQFAEKEGQKLLDSFFNAATPDEALRSLKGLKDQIGESKTRVEDMNKHFEDNNMSLSGYKLGRDEPKQKQSSFAGRKEGDTWKEDGYEFRVNNGQVQKRKVK